MIWENPFNKSSRQALLDISGDWAPIRHYGELMDSDPLSVYGDLLPELRKADWRITNLEAPLTPGKLIVKSGAAFHGEEKRLSALTQVPFDAVTLGNNHTFDCGVEGFKKTVELLNENKIAYCGAGMNKNEALKPLEVEIKNVKIAVFNFSEGEDRMAAGENTPGVAGWEIEAMESAIWQAREKFHAVIAVVHCGLEYVPTPPPYVYDCFDRLAAAGADLVVGHHPHVPQGMTFLRGKPVFFSLGNFIFYQPKQLAYRKLGYHLHVGVNENGITSVEVLPYQLTEEGAKRFDPVQFDGILDAISGCLEKRENVVEAWNGFLSYYGVEGYIDELQRILKEMTDDAGKGAAMLRNRVMTLQHLHHWNDGLTRIVSGEISKAPEWAKKLAEIYFTTEVSK
ncbi:MAG: CapA family protein [Lentisphaeria bacterium]|nr:CapA family protein [Lentisphaeria bacterium]